MWVRCCHDGAAPRVQLCRGFGRHAKHYGSTADNEGGGGQAAQPEAEAWCGGEITEAALAAREADGAASIVALYAALLTGLLVGQPAPCAPAQGLLMTVLPVTENIH